MKVRIFAREEFSNMFVVGCESDDNRSDLETYGLLAAIEFIESRVSMGFGDLFSNLYDHSLHSTALPPSGSWEWRTDFCRGES